ncbi:MAG TPA: hypothetical protein VGQ09_14330 [Chitinophagaceae bacterium]|jgi:uncharacterized membrane protein YgcG|nr:hypothetical protein [Chitinophagaceae bacterium]
MKKSILFAALLFAFFVPAKNMQAQISVGVNINIGSQPVWGPVGYDYVEYYYMPDIDVYYYVPRHQYVYLSNGRWIFSLALPVRYRYYNIYTGYKVVINEPRPYLHADVYRVKYAPYKGRKNSQVIIRNSNDPKYYVVKGHPKYGHDNGNHNGAFKNGNGGGNGNSGGNGNGGGNGRGGGKGKGKH